MEKHKSFFNCFFWFLLFSLPLLTYLILLLRAGVNAPLLSDIFSRFDLLNLADVLSSSLGKAFGADGLLPLPGFSSLMPFLAYFFSVSVLHLFYDILLFAVKFAQKCVDKIFNREVK